MKTLIANEKLDSIISLAGKKTLDTKKIISELQALREHALLEKDPLVVKVLRLSYEFLKENETFNVQAQYEAEDDPKEDPIEIDDKENLLYLLNLLKNAEHKVNREELKDYRNSLKAELY